MFSGVAYEGPSSTGKKMLGMPSAPAPIQLRKNPPSPLDGRTTITWMTFRWKSQRIGKSLARLPLKTSFRGRRSSPKEVPMSHLRLEIVTHSPFSWKDLPGKPQHESGWAGKVDDAVLELPRNSFSPAVSARVGNCQRAKNPD